MAQIMDDFQLLLAIKRPIVNEISDAVITQLKGLKEDHFKLSGDDSGLENVWEEICAQCQGEYSYDWEVYKETIENFIVEELNKQTEPVKILISYVGGLAISADFEDENDQYVYNQSYAVTDIIDDVLEKAGSCENENVNRFLDRDFDQDNDESGNETA